MNQNPGESLLGKYSSLHEEEPEILTLKKIKHLKPGRII
jgi:hypothetical protein